MELVRRNIFLIIKRNLEQKELKLGETLLNPFHKFAFDNVILDTKCGQLLLSKIDECLSIDAFEF